MDSPDRVRQPMHTSNTTQDMRDHYEATGVHSNPSCTCKLSICHDMAAKQALHPGNNTAGMHNLQEATGVHSNPNCTELPVFHGRSWLRQASHTPQYHNC
eukprot:1158613-Pelagomonas_calceolata.AAC.4